LRPGFRFDKMRYHICRDKPIQFQILKVAKRQLILFADSFYIFLNKTINSKDRNNHKFILHENVISNRDTMKIRVSHAKLKGTLKV
jgi:hypothetical protein